MAPQLATSSFRPNLDNPLHYRLRQSMTMNNILDPSTRPPPKRRSSLKVQPTFGKSLLMLIKDYKPDSEDGEIRSPQNITWAEPLSEIRTIPARKTDDDDDDDDDDNGDDDGAYKVTEIQSPSPLSVSPTTSTNSFATEAESSSQNPDNHNSDGPHPIPLHLPKITKPTPHPPILAFTKPTILPSSKKTQEATLSNLRFMIAARKQAVGSSLIADDGTHVTPRVPEPSAHHNPDGRLSRTLSHKGTGSRVKLNPSQQWRETQPKPSNGRPVSRDFSPLPTWETLDDIVSDSEPESPDRETPERVSEFQHLNIDETSLVSPPASSTISITTQETHYARQYPRPYSPTVSDYDSEPESDVDSLFDEPPETVFESDSGGTVDDSPAISAHVPSALKRSASVQPIASSSKLPAAPVAPRPPKRAFSELTSPKIRAGNKRQRSSVPLPSQKRRKVQQPVTKLAVIDWKNKLSSLHYIQNTREVTQEECDRLDDYLSRIEEAKDDPRLTGALMAEVRLAAEVRKFSHRTKFGPEAKARAKGILECWGIRFCKKLPT